MSEKFSKIRETVSHKKILNACKAWNKAHVEWTTFTMFCVVLCITSSYTYT